MKHWIILIVTVALAVGCGDTTKKTGSPNNVNNANNVNNVNNANNVVVNNQQDCPDGQVAANVKGVEGCFAECDGGICPLGFQCNSGICIPSAANNANNGNNINNVGQTCATNADCRANQECQDEICRDHQICDTADFGECLASWDQCVDGRTYQFECIGGDRPVCVCSINDVVVDEVEITEAIDCAFERIHRSANSLCGWTQPAL